VTATKTSTKSARGALTAAAEATAAAGAALNAAENDVTAAQKNADDLQQAFIDGQTTIATGDATFTRAQMDKTLEAIDKAKLDVDWANLQQKAAEAAYFRATEAEVVARRVVVAEEYVEAKRRDADPATRVNVLQSELPGLIAEFLELVTARDAHHARLVQEVQLFPEDERASVRIAAGNSHLAVDGQTGTWPVVVRTSAFVDILRTAGLEIGGR
jgi:hypothetical protein